LLLKDNISEYDELLLKLFENSLRYSKKQNSSTAFSLEDLEVDTFTLLEKKYLLDLVVLAMWSDGEKYNFEQEFILNLSQLFAIDNQFETEHFLIENQKKIPFFTIKHPVKHFYANMQENISTLVERNKNRLSKELAESKELAGLLKKAAQQDLSHEEKKKVKKQLLDICKTVPSLTIFLLPGGGFLLPILIKFIPKLLPSSFNENLNS
jgi:LETM1-like protein